MAARRMAAARTIAGGIVTDPRKLLDDYAAEVEFVMTKIGTRQLAAG